jgi:hypothetical protein
MATAIRWWQEAEKGKSDILSMSLVLGLAYMINALTSRPMDWQAEEMMREILLKDTAATEEIDGVEVQVNRLGCFFPSSIIADPDLVKIPRLGPSCVFHQAIFGKLFKQDLLTLQLAVQRPTTQGPNAAQEEIPGRIRRSRAVIDEIPAPDNDQQIVIPEEADIFGQGPLAITSPLQVTTQSGSQHVTNILARLWMDILRCIPNPKDPTSQSYCHILELERRNATASNFQDPNLASVFNKVIVMRDPKAWDLAVDSLFPIIIYKLETMVKKQHYGTCGYWPNWLILAESLSLDARTILKSLIRVSNCWNQSGKTDREMAGESSEGSVATMGKGGEDVVLPSHQ